MAIYPLSDSAEFFVRSMCLTEEDQTVIRDCIISYETPASFCDALRWIIYRITNAIKAIFGVSDWQTAKATIYDRAIEMTLDQGLLQSNPETDKEIDIKERTLEALVKGTGSLLTACFTAHQQNLRLTAQLKAKCAPMHLDAVLQKIRHIVFQANLEDTESLA